MSRGFVETGGDHWLPFTAGETVPEFRKGPCHLLPALCRFASWSLGWETLKANGSRDADQVRSDLALRGWGPRFQGMLSLAHSTVMDK